MLIRLRIIDLHRRFTIRRSCEFRTSHVWLKSFWRTLGSGNHSTALILKGHVDCTVDIVSKTLDPPNSYIYAFKVPEASPDTGNRDLLSLIVPKGYVSLDGVSLTVIDVDWSQRTFTIMMIPYTQERGMSFGNQFTLYQSHYLKKVPGIALIWKWMLSANTLKVLSREWCKDL